eukprot:s2707_g2.t1
MNEVDSDFTAGEVRLSLALLGIRLGCRSNNLRFEIGPGHPLNFNSRSALRAYLPVTPRKGRTEGGGHGGYGGHGYAPTTPTPKNASPRVGELSLPRPSLASCSARQRLRSEGSALRPSLAPSMALAATAPRTPRASILEAWHGFTIASP